MFHQESFGLTEIVEKLRASREDHSKIRHRGDVRELPSREVVKQILKGILAALFPTHYGRTDLNNDSIDYFVGTTLNETIGLLYEQIRRGLLFNTNSPAEEELEPRARAITESLASQLPDIRDVIVKDLHAAYIGDPAAQSMSEILICYPGIVAIIYYRIAHALYLLDAPLIARLITEIAHSATGIDIHPGAQIDESFFIDHGTGVVIGETSIIGKRVRLYQAVTLGAKRFPADENGHLVKGNARHPIVEDDVVVYAGATILGRVTIGQGSVIGGNVWLTHSVPAGSNITQQHAMTK